LSEYFKGLYFLIIPDVGSLFASNPNFIGLPASTFAISTALSASLG